MSKPAVVAAAGMIALSYGVFSGIGRRRTEQTSRRAIQSGTAACTPWRKDAGSSLAKILSRVDTVPGRCPSGGRFFRRSPGA